MQICDYDTVKEGFSALRTYNERFNSQEVRGEFSAKGKFELRAEGYGGVQGAERGQKSFLG